jgi:hypothetical protein
MDGTSYPSSFAAFANANSCVVRLIAVGNKAAIISAVWISSLNTTGVLNTCQAFYYDNNKIFNQ